MSDPLRTVAYTYCGGFLCPDCVFDMCHETPEALEGWQGEGDRTNDVEGALDYIAATLGIDRSDEPSYDDDEFPKALPNIGVLSGSPCDNCGEAVN